MKLNNLKSSKIIKKKLLIIFAREISKNAEIRLGINYFKREFNTTIINASSILNPEAKKFNNKYIKISKINQLEKVIKNKKFDYFLDFLGRGFLDYLIRIKIKSKGTNSICVNSLSMDQKVSDLVFETNISKFLRRIKLIFTPNILILKLLDFIRQKLFSLYKYDFAITGGAVSSESFKKSKVKIFGTCPDYFFYHKQKKRLKKKKNYAVFVDTNLPYHQDHKDNANKKLNAKKYFDELYDFFKFFESKTKIKIKIALHPRTNIYDYPKKIRRYKFYFNRTHELIKDSKIVFMHGSTAKVFGVLYKKPIVYLENSNMKSLRYLYFYTKEHSYLGSSLINFSKENLSNINIKNIFKINKKKYLDYEKNFIKHPKSVDLPWFIILNNHLNKLN